MSINDLYRSRLDEVHESISSQQIFSLKTLIDSVFNENKFYISSKRLFDFFAASICLVLLTPVFLLVSLFIRLESRGPILFKQARWGLNGEKITVYKFRSMKTELCDSTGVLQTVKGDSRVTRVGAILRKTNIDELPQLLNVVKGDMSLVGPRCHPVGMMAGGMLYEDLVPGYHERHLVRPGITGLAQVRGLRGPTDRPSKAKARIACDIYYVRNVSFRLDIKIILATILLEIRGGTGF